MSPGARRLIKSRRVGPSGWVGYVLGSVGWVGSGRVWFGLVLPSLVGVGWVGWVGLVGSGLVWSGWILSGVPVCCGLVGSSVVWSCLA